MKDKYIFDAVHKFGQLTGIQNEVSIERRKGDYHLTIRQAEYMIAARKEIRVSSKGIVLQQVKELEQRIDQPIIIV